MDETEEFEVHQSVDVGGDLDYDEFTGVVDDCPGEGSLSQSEVCRMSTVNKSLK